MSAPRAGLVRNTLGSLAVLGAICAMVLGLPLLDHSLPAVRGVAVGKPYLVGSGVTVRPPRDARLDVTKTRPGPNGGTALFVVDGVRLAVVVVPHRGGLDTGANRLREKITKSAGYQVTGAQRPMSTTRGVPGLRGSYASSGQNGEYAVFVARGLSVEVTTAGPEVSQHRVGGELERAMRSVSFGGDR